MLYVVSSTAIIFVSFLGRFRLFIICLSQVRQPNSIILNVVGAHQAFPVTLPIRIEDAGRASAVEVKTPSSLHGQTGRETCDSIGRNATLLSSLPVQQCSTVRVIAREI